MATLRNILHDLTVLTDTVIFSWKKVHYKQHLKNIQLYTYRSKFKFKFDEFLHFTLGPVPVSSQEGGDVDQKVVVRLHDGVAQAQEVVLGTRQQQVALVKLKETVSK